MVTTSTSDGVYITKQRSIFQRLVHGKSAPVAPPAVFRSADIVQEGYLLKRGQRLKRWNRRYFILRLEERHMTLSYYLNKDDLIFCSETPIGPAHYLAPVDSTKHPHRIDLRWGVKRWVLEAESATVLQVWKTMLEEAVRWNHAMVPSSSDTSVVVEYGQQVLEDERREEASRQQAARKLREKQKEQEKKSAASSKPKFLPSDRDGYQCFLTSSTKFEIPNYYTYKKTIGSGAYGVVVSAKDTRVSTNASASEIDNPTLPKRKDSTPKEELDGTQPTPVTIQPSENDDETNMFAIKNIPKAFDDLTDAKRIVREIKLMRHLSHKCVLGIHDLIPPPSLSHFEDVYIVSELMSTDLHRVIYSRHALSDEHIAFFMYQMLTAIKYVHSANVIHRDLKPSNVLVNANCELKICDFGLARGVFPDEALELTEYVVTRWYRAPEIMLGCMKYTSEVDVWSIGCIFAEMLLRKPLFPGQDYIDQLHLIMNALGAPSDSELYFLTNARARKFMNAEYHRRGGGQPVKSLKQLMTDASEDALDLMEKMLVMDPNKRITVDEALNHAYLSGVRCLEEETTAEKHFDFDFENEELTKSVLQKLIWDEMTTFHPEEMDKESGGKTQEAGEPATETEQT